MAKPGLVPPGANDFRCRPGTVNCPSSSFPGPGRRTAHRYRASNYGPRAHSAADRFDVHPEMRHGYSRNAGKTNALAWEQQISGSMLLNELTIGDITRPGVRYTFLGTRHDNAVLPH